MNARAGGADGGAQGGAADALVGVWDVAISTPIGTVDTGYTFVVRDGVLIGSAASRRETVAVEDLVLTPESEGVRATWKQAVRWPMRLNLLFDVVVEGDRLAGHSRAGRLPPSQVSGARRKENV